MISGEALDVILRIQNLKGFEAGMSSAAASTRQVGVAAREGSAMASASMQRTAQGALLVQKAAKGLVLTTAAVAFGAYKMGTEFDKQLTMVQAEAGASHKEVARMRDEILKLGPALGRGPVELAKGLYHVESLGFRGAKALEILTGATNLANISGADLELTTTSLGAAMIANVRGTGNAAHAIGLLNAIAGAGNMRMQELNEAIGSGILAGANTAHIAIADLGGAIATLTDNAVPASSAGAQLRTALHFLYAPTEKAKKALAGIGLTSTDLVNTWLGPAGFTGALKLLKSHLQDFSGDDVAKFLEVFGGILPAGRGSVLNVLMNNLDQLQDKSDQVLRRAGHVNAEIAVTNQTNAMKIKRAWAGVQSQLVQVHDLYKGPLTTVIVALVGVLTTLLGVLADNKGVGIALLAVVGGLTTAFIIQKAVVIGLAVGSYIYTAAAAIMTAALLILEGEVTTLSGLMVILDGIMAANAFGLVVIGVAALAFGLYMLIKHFDKVKHWVVTNMPIIAAVILGASFIAFGPWGLALALLVTLVIKHFKTIKSVIGDIVQWVSNAAKNVGNFFINMTNGIITAINFLIKAYNALPFHKDIKEVGKIGLIGAKPPPKAGSGIIGDVSAISHNISTGGKRVTGASPNLFLPTDGAGDSGGHSQLGQATGDIIHHTTLVLPNGKVLAETVNKHNADRKARK